MSSPIVVGAGLSAAKAVEQVRESGYEGSIVVNGNELHLPYERPPLSKRYLMGNDSFAEATVHDQHWYDQHDVELRLGASVTGIDRAEKIVHAPKGSQPYDQLLLATGASPRTLAMAEQSGAPVTYLRTIEDSNRLRDTFAPGNRIAIVGGGWIGLEVAAAARTPGCEVTVLESRELPLLRVLGPEVAQRFAALHREHGVDLRTGVQLAAVERHGDGALLRLADGGAVGADLTVVGVGVVPNVRLAEEAGLDVDNGVLVDEQLRASDPVSPRVTWRTPSIRSSAADCESSTGATRSGRGRPRRGTCWGRVRPTRGCRSSHRPVRPRHGVPREHRPDGYDQLVLRDQAAEDTFTAFWLQDGRVLAGMHANDWDATDAIRQIVGTKPDLAALMDRAVPLAEIGATSV